MAAAEPAAGPAPAARTRVVDDADRRILAALIGDARLTNRALARAVHLSPSPALRRRRLLEASGVIRRYTTIVDPDVLGLHVAAFVEVTLERGDPDGNEAFRQAALRHPEVADCFAVAGDADFFLKILAPDMAAYSVFVNETLRRLPGVRRTGINLILDPHPAVFAFSGEATQPDMREPPGGAGGRFGLDALDRRILAHMVADCRVSGVALARRTGASPATCMRRIARMERAGVIHGYTALIEPKALGLSAVAFVGLVLDRGAGARPAAIRDTLLARREVAAAHETAGDVDLMLRVTVANVEGFSEFVKDCLHRLPTIARISSSFVVYPAPRLFCDYGAVRAPY